MTISNILAKKIKALRVAATSQSNPIQSKRELDVESVRRQTLRIFMTVRVDSLKRLRLRLVGREDETEGVKCALVEVKYIKRNSIAAEFLRQFLRGVVNVIPGSAAPTISPHGTYILIGLATAT